MRPEIMYEEKNQYVESYIDGEMYYFKSFNKYDPECEDPKFLIKELRKLLSRKEYIRTKILLQKEAELMSKNKCKRKACKLWMN